MASAMFGAIRPRHGGLIWIFVVLSLLPLSACTAGTSPAAVAPMTCEDGTQDSGAAYRICMPASNWSGDLLVYAHGYVSPTRETGIPEDQMTLPGIPFLTVDQIATSQGYGFVTSGYAANGLAVRQGMVDLADAVAIFEQKYGEARHVVVVGASDGGLLAALAVEEQADVYDGALALCGPYGDYARQADYFGDFRVLFDVYFPGLLPPTAVEIPTGLIDTWDVTTYPDEVKPVITDPANAAAVAELLTVASVAHDAGKAASWEEIVARLLWYNIHATNDATTKLGGQPFDNQNRQYAGSSDDVALNLAAARFRADSAARAAIAADYETSGNIQRPLVTLHTTGDPLVPYWHITGYAQKIDQQGRSSLHEQIDVEAFGHCAFKIDDVRGAVERIIEMLDNTVYLPIVVR